MMIGMWWWLWIVFMLLFLVSPIGYGWGYRGWGAPYPRYYQRRRATAAAGGGSAAFNHHAWGWGGDFVWMILIVGAVWAIAGLLWRW